MNIDNITMLAGQLKQIGFEQMEVLLLKHICFRPSLFDLQQFIQKDSDTVLFKLCFKQESDIGEYFLQYYDVTLQKDLSPATTVVGSVNIAALESNMAAIDWKNLFAAHQENRSSDNKAWWETATAIDNICEQLDSISAQEEGLLIANKLKLRFWRAHLPEDLIGSISTFRSKSDIFQRFYYSPHNCITVDEAYRFLQNKWIEKKMQEKDRSVKFSELNLPQSVQKKTGKTNPKKEHKKNVES